MAGPDATGPEPTFASCPEPWRRLPEASVGKVAQQRRSSRSRPCRTCCRSPQTRELRCGCDGLQKGWTESVASPRRAQPNALSSRHIPSQHVFAEWIEAISRATESKLATVEVDSNVACKEAAFAPRGNNVSGVKPSNKFEILWAAL